MFLGWLGEGRRLNKTGLLFGQYRDIAICAVENVMIINCQKWFMNEMIITKMVLKSGPVVA